jgi:hypothetical protein
MGRICWASCVGGCSGGMSREHLVSRGLWKGPKVKARGFPWCAKEFAEIAPVTGKLLCRSHNSELSPLDEAAQQAFHTFEQVSEVSEVRGRLQPGNWEILTYSIDGARLERWLIKTVINLFISTTPDGRWYPDGASAPSPPSLLVEAVFGIRAVPEPIGLYFRVQPGDTIDDAGVVLFEPVLDPAERFGGAYIRLRGWNFLVWLCPDRMPALGTPNWVIPAGAEGSGLLHPLRRIEHRDQGRKSQVITFDWSSTESG